MGPVFALPATVTGAVAVAPYARLAAPKDAVPLGEHAEPLRDEDGVLVAADVADAEVRDVLAHVADVERVSFACLEDEHRQGVITLMMMYLDVGRIVARVQVGDQQDRR